MFIAGANFVLTYFALKGKIRKVFKSEEFKYYFFGTISVSVINYLYNYQLSKIRIYKLNLQHPKRMG